MDSIKALQDSRHPSLLWKRIRPDTAVALDRTDDNDPTLPPRPMPNSYWATPILLASEYPGDYDAEVATMKLKALLDVGTRDFYDLTELDELLPYDSVLETILNEKGWELQRSGEIPLANSQSPTSQPIVVRHCRFPIPDRLTPETQTLLDVLSALQDSKDRSRMAVVHCFGGIGRTGTVVGCWLVQAGYVTGSESERPGEAALQLLARKWKGVEKKWRAPRTPENRRQVDFVGAFQRLSLAPDSRDDAE